MAQTLVFVGPTVDGGAFSSMSPSRVSRMRGQSSILPSPRENSLLAIFRWGFERANSGAPDDEGDNKSGLAKKVNIIAFLFFCKRGRKNSLLVPAKFHSLISNAVFSGHQQRPLFKGWP